MQSTLYSCQTLTKSKFSRHILEKYTNIKFHEKSVSRNQVLPCRRTDRWTDRHDAANSRFPSSANATKKLSTYMNEHFNEEIPSSEVINHRSTQTYALPFVNTQFPLYVYNSKPSDPITSQFNSVQNPKPNFCLVPS